MSRQQAVARPRPSAHTRDEALVRYDRNTAKLGRPRSLWWRRNDRGGQLCANVIQLHKQAC